MWRLLPVFALFFLTACPLMDSDDPIACTEEFRSIGLEISGDSLTEFFTIRELSGDTIRIGEGPYHYGTTRFYPVLNDGYQRLLQNRSEPFRFIGKINDSLQVDQPFQIGADQCHIFKVSGPTRITL